MKISKNINVMLDHAEIEDLIRKAVIEALPGANITELNFNTRTELAVTITAEEGEPAPVKKTKAQKVAPKNKDIAANLNPAPKEEKTPMAEDEGESEPEPEAPRQAEVPNLEQVDIPEFEPDADDDIPFDVGTESTKDDNAGDTTAKPAPKKSLSLMEEVNAEVDAEEAAEAEAAEPKPKKKKLGDLFN